MDNSSSPLDTLRQLKEMLDAGALTPTEFEALKQRLVFSGPAPVPPAAPAPPVVPQPAPPAVLPAAAVPPVPPVSPGGIFELRSAALGSVLPASRPVGPPVAPLPPAPVPPLVPPPTPPVEPGRPPASNGFNGVQRPESSREPVVPPAPFIAAPAPQPGAASVSNEWVENEFPDSEIPPARSPLALILSIGGLLALLSLVVYLSFNRPPSERISSTSLTAADSLAAPIETGPQAEPLPATVAVPETIRVTPTNPAPPVQSRPTPPVRDSAARAPVAPVPADSAAGR